MTKLTTHVLDVYSGKPGKGISVELYYLNNDERNELNNTLDAVKKTVQETGL